MVKVKTFGMEIRPLKTMNELQALDETVNRFLAENGIKKVVSVSDTATTDDKGETIGLIRVVCYREKDKNKQQVKHAKKQREDIEEEEEEEEDDEEDEDEE